MRMKAAIVIGLLLAGISVGAMQFGDWSASVSLESVPGTDSTMNTVFQDEFRRTTR